MLPRGYRTLQKLTSAGVPRQSVPEHERLSPVPPGITSLPLPDGFEVTLRQEARGFQQDLTILSYSTALALILVY